MATDGYDTGRLARLLVLISFVTGVSMVTSAQTLDGRLFHISVFAIGAIAVLTAMTGVLIAGVSAYDEEPEPQ